MRPAPYGQSLATLFRRHLGSGEDKPMPSPGLDPIRMPSSDELKRVAGLAHVVGERAGGEVDRAEDLFIKEDVVHGFCDRWIEAEGKLADVARARIGVEDLVELNIVGGAVGRNDLPVLEDKMHLVEESRFVQ